MSAVNVTNVTVLDNPAAFLNPFQFEIFSEFLAPLKDVLNAIIAYANPKAPLYPLFSQGKPCNETTVTWTSGYNAMEVVPFVAWGLKGEPQSQSPVGRLTFS